MSSLMNLLLYSNNLEVYLPTMFFLAVAHFVTAKFLTTSALVVPVESIIPA